MKALLAISKLIDSFNRVIGLVVMYGPFVLMAILLWSSISKTFFVPSIWTLDLGFAPIRFGFFTRFGFFIVFGF